MKSKLPVPAWDIPTRIFHWALVLLFINAWVTHVYGDVTKQWHMWNGYAVLTLCVYRVLWGVFGSSTSRFTDFIRGPRETVDYFVSLLRGRPLMYLGHNPLGGLMVVALLLLLSVQGAMGLFTSDDIIVSGPLAYLASSSWVDLAGSIHRNGYWVILGFVVVHVSAAFFYLLIKKENLIKPMITGKKDPEIVPEGIQMHAMPWVRAMLFLCLAAAVVAFVVNIGKWL